MQFSITQASSILSLQNLVINPRRTCAARVIVLGLSFCPSVCYHVFFRYAQQDGQKVTPTGSVPHWLYLKNSDFGKNAAIESYGVKQSEGANMQISNGLPRPALRTLEAPEVATQDEYRLPRATV